MKKFTLFLCFLLAFGMAKADEGMWILKELNKMSAARM